MPIELAPLLTHNYQWIRELVKFLIENTQYELIRYQPENALVDHLTLQLVCEHELIVIRKFGKRSKLEVIYWRYRVPSTFLIDPEKLIPWMKMQEKA